MITSSITLYNVDMRRRERGNRTRPFNNIKFSNNIRIFSLKAIIYIIKNNMIVRSYAHVL